MDDLPPVPRGRGRGKCPAVSSQSGVSPRSTRGRGQRQTSSSQAAYKPPRSSAADVDVNIDSQPTNEQDGAEVEGTLQGNTVYFDIRL